ncbi:hypothetical protein ACROYT_G017282 [Oculina patagonica]
MNVVPAVFVSWAMLLMGLSFEEEGEKRSVFFAHTPRNLQVYNILTKALRDENVADEDVGSLYNYGCWCGQRGYGKTVDNFDFCCKVHDFCDTKVLRSEDKCRVDGGIGFYESKFLVNEDTNKCAPVSEYRTSNVEKKQCKHAVCLCDMEMVRCMTHYQNEINLKKINHQRCNLPGGEYCKTKADVIVLIQDSESISSTTVQSIKTVVHRLVNLLGSETQDYNFALATYATSRKMSCFGNAADTISYMDSEYHHGGSGHNLLNLALSEMVLKQFDKRRNDRKDDNTAKILVIFSDGNSEDENGDVQDTFWLEKTAKLLRVDNNIKMVGVLIPNTQNTQRIQELNGIFSEPNDAIDVAFSDDNLNGIADSLFARVRRLVCRVKYTVQVYTPNTRINSDYLLTVRIRGTGGLTVDHALHGATQEMQGGLQVIKSKVFDRDVGTIKRIEIRAKRTFGFFAREWTLEKVKVRKGKKTVTAVFGEEIPAWPNNNHWYSGKLYCKHLAKVAMSLL